MNYTINNQNYTIINDALNPNIFRIHFSYPNQSLINSLIKTKILQGSTSTDNYKTIQFKANQIQTFKEYQTQNKIQKGTEKTSITDASKMITTLVTQLKYMINFERRTFLGYNTNDLLIINGNKCLYLGVDYICDIYNSNNSNNNNSNNNNSNILISFPFKPSDFFVSPELLKIKEIPSYTHYKTSYFSLGCLIINILMANDDFYKEYLKDKDLDKDKDLYLIKEYLNTTYFKETKLYWFLSRSLEEDPEKRSLLFI